MTAATDAPGPAAPAPAPGPPPAAAPPGSGIGRDAALITVARSVQMFTFLGTGMYLARQLGGGSYGTYQHVPFLATAIPMVVAVPLAKAITYFTPRSRRPDDFLRLSACALAVMGLAAGAAIAFVPAVLRAFDPGDARLVAARALVGPIVGFSFAQAISEYVLIARGRRSGVVKLLLAQSAWNVLAIGGAAALAPEPTRLWWTLAALLGSTALPAVVTFRWLLAPSGAPADAPGPTRREVAAYMLPLVGAVGVNYAAAQIDKLLVPWLFPMGVFPDAKDHYFRAAMDVPIVGAVAFTMFSLVAPEMAGLHGRGDREGLLETWRRTCHRLAVITVPVAGLLCAVAHEAFTLVYGDRYAPAVPIFRWYLVRLVAMAFMPQILLEAVGATGRSFLFSGVALCTACALTGVLVLQFGLPGMAAAVVLSAILTNWVFGGWLVRRELGVPWGALADWGHVAKLAACASAGVAAAVWLVPADWAPDLAPALASWFPSASAETLASAARAAARLSQGAAHALVYTAVFLPMALGLRCVTRDDLSMLRDLVKRRPKAA